MRLGAQVPRAPSAQYPSWPRCGGIDIANVELANGVPQVRWWCHVTFLYSSAAHGDPLRKAQRNKNTASLFWGYHEVHLPFSLDFSMNYFLLSWIIHFSVNSNFVENELIAGFEWNVHHTQIDLTWLVVAFNHFID